MNKMWWNSRKTSHHELALNNSCFLTVCVFSQTKFVTAKREIMTCLAASQYCELIRPALNDSTTLRYQLFVTTSLKKKI